MKLSENMRSKKIGCPHCNCVRTVAEFVDWKESPCGTIANQVYCNWSVSNPDWEFMCPKCYKLVFFNAESGIVINDQLNEKDSLVNFLKRLPLKFWAFIRYNTRLAASLSVVVTFILICAFYLSDLPDDMFIGSFFLEDAKIIIFVSTLVLTLVFQYLLDRILIRFDKSKVKKLQSHYEIIDEAWIVVAICSLVIFITLIVLASCYFGIRWLFDKLI